MDPNEALRQIKAAVKAAETAMKHGNYPLAESNLETAAELDNALTAWVHRGGFKPRGWVAWHTSNKHAKVIAKFITDGGYGPGLR
jgi:hypothetical protein